MSSEFSVTVLGPIRAARENTLIRIGTARQREVLAVLALRAGAVLSTTQLIDAMWSAPRPASAENMVHTYIARLRRVLQPVGRQGAPATIVRSSRPGYTLDIPMEAVDLHRFRCEVRCAREARARGDLPEALRLFRQALSRCHGPFAQEATGPLAEAERIRLYELREDAVEEAIGVRLMLGDDRDVVAELRGTLTEQPLRERSWELLLVALGQASRRAEALAAFQSARLTLIDRLGVEPGRELQDLYLRLLHNEPVTVRRWWDGPVQGDARAGDTPGQHGRGRGSAKPSAPASQPEVPIPLTVVARPSPGQSRMSHRSAGVGVGTRGGRSGASLR